MSPTSVSKQPALISAVFASYWRHDICFIHFMRFYASSHYLTPGVRLCVATR